MRIAVCDDNRDFLAQSQATLSQWFFQGSVPVVDAFEDGDSLIQAHTATPYDIILLDVVMPLLNGIDAAREIRENDKSVKIVFLTSSPEFAVDSYSVKASNYLLKPLDEKKLHLCLDEIAEELQKNARCINIRSASAVHRIELNNIEYIEAQNKRVIFSLCSGECIASTEPLYAIEGRLAVTDGFFKCSRSYIVNLHHISSYAAKELQMRSGCRIPISRNLHKEFEEIYFNTFFGKAGELF